MTTNRSARASIDNYIATFPPEVRTVLQRVRQVVRDAAPDAREVISYRMPAFKLNGIIVYFAAFKNHIGFYPPIKGDVRIEKAASPYAGVKGNLKFPLNRPIPFDLISRLTKLRVKQDLAKAATSRKKRRA